MGSISVSQGVFNVQKIAIIGAGPAGLGVAKYLLAENAFGKIDIFEQQSEVGGVWNYTRTVNESVSIPQTTPKVLPEKPIWPEGAKAPFFSNPMYERLNTNIPKTLMQYSDLDFPSDSLLFPTRQHVQEYLVRYSQDIRHLITFSAQVEDVSLLIKDGVERWKLTTKSTVTGEAASNEYDAIVVANGHYSVPFIPSVPGIEKFNAAYPSIISHSKIYRSPKSFANKKVVVIGSSASGLDIGNQISLVSKRPLLNSVRESSPIKIGIENKEEVPPIAEYIVKDRSVRFENGRIETDIDAIVYCTGYLYSYPFLNTLDPQVVTNGRRVIGTYKQLFSISHPTLAFPVLAQRVIPFPLSEVQGAAIAKVWSNNLCLPEKEEMLALEKKQVEEKGDNTNFHYLGYPEDAAYINELHDWVGRAENGFAKEPVYWNENARLIRSMFARIRTTFIASGGKVKTISELGGEFEGLD